MSHKKILGLIGLAARARKICFGADSVALEMKKRKVFLVVIATDASDRTKEKFKKIGEEHNIPVMIEGEIEILSKAIGKSNKAIIGIKNENIAKEVMKIKNGGEHIG